MSDLGTDEHLRQSGAPEWWIAARKAIPSRVDLETREFVTACCGSGLWAYCATCWPFKRKFISDAVRSAVLAEREACAEFVDDQARRCARDAEAASSALMKATARYDAANLRDLAASIRARP